jgi:hypothetical protein
MMMNVKQSVEKDLGGETKVLEENLCQCHCPPQIPDDLTRDRTQAAAMGSRPQL